MIDLEGFVSIYLKINQAGRSDKRHVLTLIIKYMLLIRNLYYR